MLCARSSVWPWEDLTSSLGNAEDRSAFRLHPFVPLWQELLTHQASWGAAPCWSGWGAVACILGEMVSFWGARVHHSLRTLRHVRSLKQWELVALCPLFQIIIQAMTFVCGQFYLFLSKWCMDLWPFGPLVFFCFVLFSYERKYPPALAEDSALIDDRTFVLVVGFLQNIQRNIPISQW